jgi:hypothetical protein
MPAFAYSARLAIASAQKWGGVQTKMTRNSSNAFASTLFWTAAQPSRGVGGQLELQAGIRRHELDDYAVLVLQVDRGCAAGNSEPCTCSGLVPREVGELLQVVHLTCGGEIGRAHTTETPWIANSCEPWP